MENEVSEINWEDIIDKFASYDGFIIATIFFRIQHGHSGFLWEKAYGI